jgi:gluconate 2-dehydrogenase subunit 3-like protein
MPDPSSIESLLAVVETLVPPVDGSPGAAELGVQRHVADAIEKALPNFVDLIAMLLDGYATDVRSGATFVQLSPEERTEVFRAMSNEESGDVRDMIDALMVFTYGGMYSEWTGYDRGPGSLDPPQAWKDMGYHGPVGGHPNYRQGI